MPLISGAAQGLMPDLIWVDSPTLLEEVMFVASTYSAIAIDAKEAKME